MTAEESSTEQSRVYEPSVQQLAQWLEKTYKDNEPIFVGGEGAWLLTAKRLQSRYSLVVDSKSLKEGIYSLMQLAQNENMTDEFMWKKVEHFVDERLESHFKEEEK
jgi:hypothetical protein